MSSSCRCTCLLSLESQAAEMAATFIKAKQTINANMQEIDEALEKFGQASLNALN